MPTIKVKFKLNPGREGISLTKLARHAENIERLIQSAARDVGIDDADNIWIAKKFSNGSVICTAELQAVASVEEEAGFRDIMRGLAVSPKRSKKEIAAGIVPPSASTSLPPQTSPKTLAAFAEFKDPLDVGESVGIGLWNAENTKLSWTNVPRLRFAQVSNFIEPINTYFGSVIGYTYEWNMGADSPFIKLRDVASGDLVRCNYSKSDYKNVARLFEQKGALVVVYGTISFDRISLKTEITKAVEFEVMPQLSDSDFTRFFGCAPNMTGNKTADEFIREGREDSEE